MQLNAVQRTSDVAVQRTSDAKATSDHERTPTPEARQQPGVVGALLGVQRAYGNRRLGRLLQTVKRGNHVNRAGLQRTLMTGARSAVLSRRPQIAETTAGLTPSVQAKCASCEEEDRAQQKPDDEQVQLQPLASRADAPPPEDEETFEQRRIDSVERRLSSSEAAGGPLPGQVRTEMESAFDADFSGVKVHTDQTAAEMSDDLGAAAFTHGKNIYFNADTYNPSSGAGRTLLAHELTHVVQQTGRGRQRPPSAGTSRRPLRNTPTRDVLQLDPNVTAVTGPAEMPANQGSRITVRATAPRGTRITWSGAANGAALGASTGLTNTLTAPVGSTGGVVTVRAEDATDATDFATLDVLLVEVQQPTFTPNPAVGAVIVPVGGAFPANTVEASVCGNVANSAVVTVPARPVTWSIVGNRRGATIDPATGDVTPSVTQTGDIIVRAADTALPAARNQQTLTVRAHPQKITNTIRTGTTAAAGLGTYGSVYDHIFQSSGGPLTGVNVSEQVFCGSDPFNFCPGAMPVLPGLPNVWPLTPARRMVSDNMLTGATLPGIDVNRFLPSPPNPGLPQVLTTPQILYWRSEQCGQWIPFQNVPIQFILRRNAAGNFETVTINNKIAAPPEPYTGPALAAPGAPAASVCAPGEGLSNITFSPPVIGADNSPLTTTAATVQVRPGGNLVTWTLPGPTFGVALVAPGNPALFSAGNIAGKVRVRAAITATPGCFTEAWLRMEEVVIGPGITLSPARIRPGATTRATVSTKPGPRIVNWTIVGAPGAALGAVIAANADNSATITAGAQVGRITIRATDARDATRFADTSLVIN